MKIRGFASDGLVNVWKDLRAGRHDAARQRLLLVWRMGMDALATEQMARVALGLFRRLGPCTDDADAWARLPEHLTVYRAGGPGLSWTLSRETAERLRAEHGLAPVRAMSVNKADVLAYITERGEDELVLPPR